MRPRECAHHPYLLVRVVKQGKADGGSDQAKNLLVFCTQAVLLSRAYFPTTKELVGRTFQASRGGIPARGYGKSIVVNALQKGRKGERWEGPRRCQEVQSGRKSGISKREDEARRWQEVERGRRKIGLKNEECIVIGNYWEALQRRSKGQGRGDRHGKGQGREPRRGEKGAHRGRSGLTGQQGPLNDAGKPVELAPGDGCQLRGITGVGNLPGCSTFRAPLQASWAVRKEEARKGHGKSEGKGRSKSKMLRQDKECEGHDHYGARGRRATLSHA